jgi:hypothetical protein
MAVISACLNCISEVICRSWLAKPDADLKTLTLKRSQKSVRGVDPRDLSFASQAPVQLPISPSAFRELPVLGGKSPSTVRVNFMVAYRVAAGK